MCMEAPKLLWLTTGVYQDFSLNLEIYKTYLPLFLLYWFLKKILYTSREHNLRLTSYYVSEKIYVLPFLFLFCFVRWMGKKTIVAQVLLSLNSLFISSYSPSVFVNVHSRPLNQSQICSALLTFSQHVEMIRIFFLCHTLQT